MNIRILFWLYKSKVNSKGLAPIFLRITLDGEKTEVSTGKYIQPKFWDSKKNAVRNACATASEINSALIALRSQTLTIYNKLQDKNISITPEVIKSKLTNKNEDSKTLLEAFTYHNKLVFLQIGKHVSRATYVKYCTLYKKVEAFITHKYSRKDLFLHELNHQFVAEFEVYLKIVEAISHNPTMKYIQFLKKIINLSLSHGWLDKNPFQNFKCTIKENERGFLSAEELKCIEDKKISIERLSIVKDMFVFSCYTGLSYSDVRKLSMAHIQRKEDGSKWIVTTRAKTGIRAAIPLLPKANQILNKYLLPPSQEAELQPIMPISSNQKTNAYLKEIADLCGITKNLTYHLARHTFATTITLSNGVPIETVSKMLGHTNLKTTQHYAKVIDTKILSDMKCLL